jgi:hypothetical protein
MGSTSRRLIILSAFCHGAGALSSSSPLLVNQSLFPKSDNIFVRKSHFRSQSEHPISNRQDFERRKASIGERIQSIKRWPTAGMPQSRRGR